MVPKALETWQSETTRVRSVSRCSSCASTRGTGSRDARDHAHAAAGLRHLDVVSQAADFDARSMHIKEEVAESLVLG